jgi:hypothetical protein
MMPSLRPKIQRSRMIHTLIATSCLCAERRRWRSAPRAQAERGRDQGAGEHGQICRQSLGGTLAVLTAGSILICSRAGLWHWLLVVCSTDGVEECAAAATAGHPLAAAVLPPASIAASEHCH